MFNLHNLREYSKYSNRKKKIYTCQSKEKKKDCMVDIISKKETYLLQELGIDFECAFENQSHSFLIHGTL
jgi:hypothetical protein